MAATAPLGALLGGASAPPSYASMASRAIPFSSRPFNAGVWREINTVAFMTREYHFPQGQKSVKELRSSIINVLEARGLLEDIDCLQILRDKMVKIVFKSAEASQLFFDSGFSLNGVNVELRPPFKPVTRVIVQDVPFHMPAHLIRTAFSTYGDVKSITFRRATDALRSGDRIVSLDLKHSIPRHIMIGGFYATIFYSGQPPFCEICKKDHLTSRCPLKGKCRYCREVGHMGRVCPQRDGCAECGEGGHVRLDCPSCVVVVQNSQSSDEDVNVVDVTTSDVEVNITDGVDNDGVADVVDKNVVAENVVAVHSNVLNESIVVVAEGVAPRAESPLEPLDETVLSSMEVDIIPSSIVESKDIPAENVVVVDSNVLNESIVVVAEGVAPRAESPLEPLDETVLSSMEVDIIPSSIVESKDIPVAGVPQTQSLCGDSSSCPTPSGDQSGVKCDSKGNMGAGSTSSPPDSSVNKIDRNKNKSSPSNKKGKNKKSSGVKRRLPPVVGLRPPKLPASRKHQASPTFEMLRRVLCEDSPESCDSGSDLC